jgi:predicted alpha-1,6-mannanase (GH76 family)
MVMKMKFVRSLSAVAMMFLFGALTAAAWTTADAIKAFDDYNHAMYYVSPHGRGYYRETEGDRKPDSFWHFAEEIELACDAAGLTNDPVYVKMISRLCDGFTAENGADWSSNRFNDDLMWAAIAFCRSYEITGNRTYLRLAKTNFDLAYDRGWDTNSGGMYQTTANDSKNACINYPASIAAYYIYNDGGGSNYLVKARATYEWGQSNLFDVKTGRVADSTHSRRSYSYNQGTCVGAAYFLGDYKTCELATSFTMNELAQRDGPDHILPSARTGGDGGGFNGIFFRWAMKYIASQTKQAPYLRWLQGNITQAQSMKRASDGLCWCRWLQATPPGNLRAWDCTSMVVGMLTIPASQ